MSYVSLTYVICIFYTCKRIEIIHYINQERFCSTIFIHSLVEEFIHLFFFILPILFIIFLYCTKIKEKGHCKIFSFKIWSCEFLKSRCTFYMYIIYLRFKKIMFTIPGFPFTSVNLRNLKSIVLNGKREL